VKTTVTGSGEVLAAWSDPAVLEPNDSEMADDLVVATVNRAVRSAADAAAGDMGGLTGGTDLVGLSS
jgi:nucleoid-associated protein EbfC